MSWRYFSPSISCEASGKQGKLHRILGCSVWWLHRHNVRKLNTDFTVGGWIGRKNGVHILRVFHRLLLDNKLSLGNTTVISRSLSLRWTALYSFFPFLSSESRPLLPLLLHADCPLSTAIYPKSALGGHVLSCICASLSSLPSFSKAAVRPASDEKGVTECGSSSIGSATPSLCADGCPASLRVAGRIWYGASRRHSAALVTQ